jgi:biopolymer transport protein ExbB
MNTPILDAFLGYLDAGGFVMLPLVGATLVLWYTIGFRALTLVRGTRMSLRGLLGRYRQDPRSSAHGIIARAARDGAAIELAYPGRVRHLLDDAFFHYYQEVRRGRTIILGIVSVAPLVGLLGTVSGMIETFDSLGDMSLFAQSGGIAGGISQALFSTQMGLSVAIPGVIVGRLLDRRQHRIEDELDQIKAHLGGAA